MNIKHHATKLALAAALVGLPASVAVASSPAGALPRQGNTPATCPVVNTDSNGNETVTWVPEGTRVGLFVCGSDGNWHFGWLIDGRTSGPDSPVSRPDGDISTAP